MAYDFDRVIDRRPFDSIKWNYYDPDVLPMWIADMDFAAPEPVLSALRERVSHGVLGYPSEPAELKAVLIERLQRLYGWTVPSEAILYLPGVVVGFNLAIRAVASPGEGVLVQTPVYYPILWAPANSGCSLDEMQLTRLADGSYAVDYDAFEACMRERTRIFILCNPHNPVGRVFRRDELERMAEPCLRHDLVICSDEIHCDLLFDGHQHVPIASLDPEIADRTITLMAPSKTFNMAGLQFSMAVVTNRELRERLLKAGAGLVPKHLCSLSYAAALAAYKDGQSWLDGLLRYLSLNRDYVVQFVAESMPGLSVCGPEGTYLAWIDCRQAKLTPNPHRFFLEKARVAVNDGASFGRGGEGFVRLNFACPRSTLSEGLRRMSVALSELGTAAQE